MKKQTLQFLTLIFLGMVFLISCKEPPQKATPKSNPKVIRQKIIVASKAQADTTKNNEPSHLTDNIIAPQKNSKNAIKNKIQDVPIKKNKITSTKSTPKPVPVQKKQQKQSSSRPGTKNASNSSPSETEMEILLKKLAPKPFKYRPQGNVDPFLPLIAKKKKTTTAQSDIVHKSIRKKRTRILTLLEKYDLSQLKLTAVLRTPKNAVAIVEETSGRGFVVNTGTRIGVNSGRVVDILMDRIIIQEIEELIAGKKLYVTREMKLNKPDSEF